MGSCGPPSTSGGTTRPCPCAVVISSRSTQKQHPPAFVDPLARRCQCCVRGRSRKMDRFSGTVAPAVLPDAWGVDDLALVLQDKRFTADGSIDYTLTANDQLVGYADDRLLVNGTFGPTWSAPRQWVRLRLLNGVPWSHPRTRGRRHDGAVHHRLTADPGWADRSPFRAARWNGDVAQIAQRRSRRFLLIRSQMPTAARAE